MSTLVTQPPIRPSRSRTSSRAGSSASSPGTGGHAARTRLALASSGCKVATGSATSVYDDEPWIAPAEDLLRRIVAAHVAEVCQQERIGTDDSTHDRLALEILAGMNRTG